MNLQRRKLSQLRVYENNPRHNTDAVEKVKRSIESYGYKVPIVIDRDNIIVAGHTRFAALLQINEATGQYDEIQVIIADDLTENQVKQFRIVDNQVAALADWDFLKLRVELDSIEDFILDDFGHISGFDQDIHIEEDLPEQESSDRVIISVGPNKIELTEAQFYEWSSYVTRQYNVPLIEWVRSQLQIDPQNRTFNG